MSKIEMEVLSYEEALEICEANGYEFKGCELENRDGSPTYILYADNPNGYSEDESDYIEEEVLEPKKNCVVCTPMPTGTMYVAAHVVQGSGCTFNVTDAKRFSQSDADAKAYNMNKHGGYNWRVLKVG